MVNSKILNGNKLEPIADEENSKNSSTPGKNELGKVIKDFWGEKTGNRENFHQKQIKQGKKLTLKLKTKGLNSRKITLKLESAHSHVHPNNYLLLSELLKDFFKTTE